MTTPLRLAIFDVDGTLVDSQHNICEAMAMAFEAGGLEPLSNETVHKVIGLSLQEAIEKLLLPDQVMLAPRITCGYKTAYGEIVKRPDYEDPMFPGAADALDQLDAAGYLLGLATSKSRKGVQRFIDTHDYGNRFLTVRTADDGPGKPDPFMIDEAVKETGVDMAQTVMIGDTSFDIQMACNAGAIPVGVAWGYHENSALVDAGARTVLESFTDLFTTVEQLMGES